MNTDPQLVITGLVRFGYAHVFEPHSVEADGDKKFSVTIMIPKGDTATLAKVKAAIDAAKEDGKATKFKGVIPPNLKTPLRDGDLEKPDSEEYENMYFFNASTINRPSVVDVNLNEIMDRNEFYSGCWGRASVRMYAYDNRSKGIAAGLNNVQKIKDGDKLGGGGTTAAQDFGEPLNDPLLG